MASQAEKSQAEKLREGLIWLAKAGRPGAKELAEILNPEKDNLEEAMLWLDDINNQVEF